jgi:hypothetical protein
MTERDKHAELVDTILSEVAERAGRYRLWLAKRSEHWTWRQRFTRRSELKKDDKHIIMCLLVQNMLSFDRKHREKGRFLKHL